MLTNRALPKIPLEPIILALLGILYTPLLWHWVDGWLNKSISIQHEYFSHGLLGIPFCRLSSLGSAIALANPSLAAPTG